ncbi:MAG: hypothetical protein J6X11_09140 [Treponema sp.]|nr:hypothetical protein [Treponema sp.]
MKHSSKDLLQGLFAFYYSTYIALKIPDSQDSPLKKLLPDVNAKIDRKKEFLYIAFNIDSYKSFGRCKGRKVMFLSNKKYFIICVMFLLYSFVFSAEKEPWLNNSHYKPLVEKIETSLLTLDNVSKVNVYKAAPPYPFLPDLFYVEVVTSNGHEYIVECVPDDLTFYKASTRIRRIDGIEYVTVRKYLWKESSDRGIVLSKISGIKNIQVKNLKDFFENEEKLYEYFAQPSDGIQHETNSSIIFYKIKEK